MLYHLLFGNLEDQETLSAHSNELVAVCSILQVLLSHFFQVEILVEPESRSFIKLNEKKIFYSDIHHHLMTSDTKIFNHIECFDSKHVVGSSTAQLDVELGCKG